MLLMRVDAEGVVRGESGGELLVIEEMTKKVVENKIRQNKIVQHETTNLYYDCIPIHASFKTANTDLATICSATVASLGILSG